MKTSQEILDNLINASVEANGLISDRTANDELRRVAQVLLYATLTLDTAFAFGKESDLYIDALGRLIEATKKI